MRLLSLMGLVTLFCISTQAEDLFPRSYWKLTPDAEKLLEKFAEEGKNYRTRTPHTMIFPRAQLKYQLDRSDYLHRWYDRPLLQDTSLARFNKRGFMINTECAKMLKHAVMDLGMLDGVAFFPGTSGRESFFQSSEEVDLPILPELINDTPRYQINSVKHAGIALRSKNAFRIDGKVVMTGYPVIRDLAFIRNFRAQLQKEYGDKFILMPYLFFLPPDLTPEPGQPTDAKCLLAIAEHIRSVLRESEGFYVADYPMIWDRRVQTEYGEKVMIPLLHKIFSEPEFKNKYLGFHWPQGHENSYRWSYGIDSEGTATLCRLGEFMLKLRPDFCVLPEWDEENENTSYRPTVDTGFSAMRLMRYYSSQFRGVPPTPFPGDDPNVPNMILSYRKQLLIGETAEFQLTNVPDGAKRQYRVRLALTDLAGKIVRTFDEQTISSEKCTAVSFKVPAAELLTHQAVLPRLEISWEDGSYRADNGFWPLEVRGNWTAEWRWVKQPLRERLTGIKADLNVTETSDGLLHMKGNFSTPVPVAQLELLQGVDTVWMEDSRPALRETENQVVIDIGFQNFAASLLSGTINILDAPSAKMSDEKQQLKKIPPVKTSYAPRHYFVQIPRSEAKNAVIDIDLPPAFQCKIPVKDILAKHVIGFNSPNGESMVLSRYNSQVAIPKHGKIMEAKIDFFVEPSDAKSLFSLRAIDESGRIWRGAALSIRKPLGKNLTLPVYDRETRKCLTVTADESHFVQHVFDFSPGHGSVVPNSAGRKYWGILNGFIPLVSGFGSGTFSYGSLPANSLAKCHSLDIPRRTKEPEGFWSLEFQNGSHLSLPLQIVPYYTGFRMSMKIQVPKLSFKPQTIFSSGPNGISLTILNGQLKTTCFSDQNYFASEKGSLYASSPKALEPGKWHTLTLERDGKEFWLTVDGVKGEPTPFCGSILRHMAGCLGMGFNPDSGFNGKIADFRIEVGK